MRQQQGGGYLARPAPSALAEVIEVILDKGLVIDAFVRISLVGIELLTVDARIVVSSADTHLRFAEAANRLDVGDAEGINLPEALAERAGQLIENVASNVAERKVDDALDTVGDTFGEPAEKAVRAVGGKAFTAVQKVAEHVLPDRPDPSAEDPGPDDG